MSDTFTVHMERDRHPTITGPGFVWALPWNKGETINGDGIAECIAKNMTEVYDEQQQVIETEAARAKARIEELKDICKGLNRDKNTHFSQSCENLKRAEAAEKQLKCAQADLLKEGMARNEADKRVAELETIAATERREIGLARNELENHGVPMQEKRMHHGIGELWKRADKAEKDLEEKARLLSLAQEANSRHVAQIMELEGDVTTLRDRLGCDQCECISEEQCSVCGFTHTRFAELEEAAKAVNTACGDALELLWKEIVLAKSPDYGPWEYPGQAYRHIKAEFVEMREKVESAIMNFESMDVAICSPTVPMRLAKDAFDCGIRHLREALAPKTAKGDDNAEAGESQAANGAAAKEEDRGGDNEAGANARDEGQQADGRAEGSAS